MNELRKLELSIERIEKTVLVQGMHPRVDERDIFDLFSQFARVVDINLIRDQRSRTSRGVAYVEFSDKEGAAEAMQQHGALLQGHPISVVPVQTQAVMDISHRAAAKAAGIQALPKVADARVWIGSISPQATAAQLQQVMQEAGDVDVDVHRLAPIGGTDAALGRSPDSWAIAQYKTPEAAIAAVQTLNGRVVAGMPLVLRLAHQAPMLRPAFAPAVALPGAVSMSSAAAAAAAPAFVPTTCVLIRHLSSPQHDPNWSASELQAEVFEELERIGLRAENGASDVVGVHVAPTQQEDCVWVLVGSVTSALKLYGQMINRSFDGRTLVAEFVPPSTFPGEAATAPKS